MLVQKKWKIINELQITNDELQIANVIDLLLKNRGIDTEQEREAFLHPQLDSLTPESVGIDLRQLTKAAHRIAEAIEKKEQIIVFGDYDVDGITGTAILWETLHALGGNVMPYIPHRVDEGYGLSIRGIENIIDQQSKLKDISLIITVDNGIVAHEAVAFANARGIQVIITDHHTRSDVDPDAYAIVHTTKLCGAGVGYVLTQEIKSRTVTRKEEKSRNDKEHLDLVALATVADLVPLTEANRTVLLHGLKALQGSDRMGIKALCDEAQIDQKNIGVYEIGHIIAPRLNAMGRMANAMDSLRLLCTKDLNRARILADKLGKTNRERQLVTQQLSEHAISEIKNQKSGIKNILFVYDELYEPGVIGLVASKLVETYYRPAIVLAKGEKYSKASARSISGFNIIEFIRRSSHLLVNAGGHPMAAGFTIETEKLFLLQEAMETAASGEITEDLLQRSIRIDCELRMDMISQQLYDAIQNLAPFGMANYEPVFVSRNIQIADMRTVGIEGKHLKLGFWTQGMGSKIISAIGFGLGELAQKLEIGDSVDIVYTIDENEWRGNKSLQLKVRDMNKTRSSKAETRNK